MSYAGLTPSRLVLLERTISLKGSVIDPLIGIRVLIGMVRIGLIAFCVCLIGVGKH